MGIAVPSPSSDHELVAAAQRGDHAAFEELVARHADALHRVVRRMVPSEHDAHEVTQEAFVRAWRALPGFRAEAEFFTWLYRIGCNEAKRLTSRAQMTATASLDAIARDPADPAPGPAGSAEHRDLQTALNEAIAELSPEYRLPLVLRDIEGLTTQQAMQILGLREAALKSRLHRARMQVRTAIADYL